jgi:transposase
MDIKIQPAISSPKRGPYRRHTTEFKRDVVARSLAVGTSVSRVAREFNINANQLFTWRKQFGDMRREAAAAACQLLPITVTEPTAVASAGTSAACTVPVSGVIVLAVGSAQLRVEGNVDPAMLAQVLACLLP